MFQNRISVEIRKVFFFSNANNKNDHPITENLCIQSDFLKTKLWT